MLKNCEDCYKNNRKPDTVGCLQCRTYKKFCDDLNQQIKEKKKRKKRGQIMKDRFTIYNEEEEEYELKVLAGECSQAQVGELIYNLADTLGPLEDLGYPLDFVLLPCKKTGDKKIWYHDSWCDVIRIVPYEQSTRPYMEVKCVEYDYPKLVFLDDYKVTWWLEENKES